MKLQVNDAGSWRHVLTFERTVELAVRQRAIKLVAVVNERCKMRILDDKGVPSAYCKGPDFSWEEKAQ